MIWFKYAKQATKKKTRGTVANNRFKLITGGIMNKTKIRQSIPRLFAEYDYVPPDWLRYFVPWFIIKWIDRNFDFCWPELASWKMGMGADRLHVKEECFTKKAPIHAPLWPCWCCKYPTVLIRKNHFRNNGGKR